MDPNLQTAANVSSINMDNQPPTGTSGNNSQVPVKSPANHKKVGPIIVVLVIVLVLIIAALYIFASSLNRQAVPYDNTTAANGADTVQPVTNTSTDVQTLQNDLNNSTTGLDNHNF